MDIDIVIAWVDDSDPVWRAERDRWTGRTDERADVRFRDWGLLRYWFRSVEQYMPWVRKIFFVTHGHVPQWLVVDHPKLCIVRHEAFIPPKYLPTFSANPIELNFHRIEGLSEHFVYFNDDMVITQPLRPKDVFIDGLPCASAVVSPLIAFTPGWPFGHILLNDISVTNSHFKPSTTVWKQPGKWFSLKYGKYIGKNLFNLLGRDYFLGFEEFHEPSSMLKSTYDAMWDLEPEILDETCSHRFRSIDDVNQYVLKQHNFCTGRFAPRSPKCVGYFDLGYDDERLFTAIRDRQYKFIVANDSAAVEDLEGTKRRLHEALQAILPRPSSYEREEMMEDGL